MSVLEYVGMRYIPKFNEPIEWDKTKEYEYFSIVQYLGDTYLSKKNVPANIEINNPDYWLRSASFNGQYESIRHLLDIDKKVINYGSHGSNIVIRKFNGLVNIEINFHLDDSSATMGILEEQYRPNNPVSTNAYYLIGTEYQGEYIASINNNGIVKVDNINATVISSTFIQFNFTYFKE